MTIEQTPRAIEFREEFDIPSGTAQTRGHGANGRTWKSPSHARAAAAWQALFERHRPERPFAGAVRLAIRLEYARGSDVGPRVQRPDLDNICKVAIDALAAAGYLRDDAQVCELAAAKDNRPDLPRSRVTLRLSEAEMPQKPAKTRKNPQETAKKPQK